MSDDDILEFDFEGVDPAVSGGRIALPRGEYNLQCTALRKYLKGDKGGTQQGDPNNPGLAFTFVVNNHPEFTGQEFKLYHPLGEKTRPFLLNTLMCLIPDKPWQSSGIKVPLSALIQQAVGRPCNGLIDWEINVSKETDRKYVNNNLTSLKAYDPTIIPPVATEGNPPTVVNDSPSALSQKAASGVSKEEVNEFLSGWDQSSTAGTPAAPAPAPGGNDFFDETF